MIFTPMKAEETRVYLAGRAGGFDLRNCPAPQELAAFIARSCNRAAELQRQLAAAKNTLEQIAGSYPVTDEGETLASLACDALKELAK